MKKKELVTVLAGNMDITKKDASLYVENLIDIMFDALASGEDVELYGFGKFKLSTRKAYTARNPQTGDPIEVPEKQVVTFKAAKRLKEAVL
jgi:DNA-binding protein HU-beta